MPRTETIEKTIYKFSELSDRAKEKARDWYREGLEMDSEYVIDQASEAGKLIGIDLNQRPVKLMNGGTRYKPAVYWSGFSSQGDGACFECRYSYAKGGLAAIMKEFPTDTKLHAIARDLQKLQRKHFYKLTASTKHRGHYYHERSMDVSAERDGTAWFNGLQDVEHELADIFADFASWIYRGLEAEWEYINSDEAVDESLEANEYEFEEDGSLVAA